MCKVFRSCYVHVRIKSIDTVVVLVVFGVHVVFIWKDFLWVIHIIVG